MDYITMGVGILPLLYGVYCLIQTQQGNLEKFDRLEGMKDKFGEKGGMRIHYISYVFLPFSIGIMLILFGFFGYSLMEIFLFRK